MNDDILPELPAEDVRAPAVVDLMGNSVRMARAQEFLDRNTYGNEGSAVFDELKFDISTFELNMEFRMMHRHSGGDFSELANSLVTGTDLS